MTVQSFFSCTTRRHPGKINKLKTSVIFQEWSSVLDYVAVDYTNASLPTLKMSTVISTCTLLKKNVIRLMLS